MSKRAQIFPNAGLVLPVVLAALTFLTMSCGPAPRLDEGSAADILAIQSSQGQKVDNNARKTRALASQLNALSDHVDSLRMARLGTAVAGTIIGHKLVDKIEIHFDKNDFELDREAKKNIDGIASKMSKTPYSILEIGGHADATGSSWYNLHLSEQRAKSVSRYLVDEYYVSYHRIHTIGFGFDNPKYALESSELHKNRRVVVKLLAPEIRSSDASEN